MIHIFLVPSFPPYILLFCHTGKHSVLKVLFTYLYPYLHIHICMYFCQPQISSPIFAIKFLSMFTTPLRYHLSMTQPLISPTRRGPVHLWMLGTSFSLFLCSHFLPCIHFCWFECTCSILSKIQKSVGLGLPWQSSD